MLIRLFHTIKHLRVIVLLMLLCCCHLAANAQYFDLKGNNKRTTIPFRMIRDMIIIQLNINSKGPFNFILDTGVGLMLITDPKLVDSINIVSKRTLKISGIGEGDAFEAYVTSALDVQIRGLTSYDVAAAILKTDHFGLSNYAGIPIHGLLGYEFFNNLAVKIDFSDSTLTVSKPKNMKLFRKASKIPISIEDRKPYINTKVTYADGVKADNKLVFDLGAGHSLSLENAIEKHGLPAKFVKANLGVGLTGPVNGFLSRVKELDIGKYKIKDVITSFPEGEQFKSLAVKRDGNLGIGILKRFTVIIDYPDSALYLKQGSNFKQPFEHDMSGLEYYSAGENFSRIIISRVEPGSPGDLVGLAKDDEILAINLKPVVKMTLEQIDSIFKSQADRSLLLEIYRDNRRDDVILTLKRRI
ncbi:aspartyl protease family protein [Mucilaginibacter sp.]|uniref:aspartyl protease family protein n=1 Tax=Mucilaginibacter sp. TaxID=1882438 RepID=UPI00262848BC|nr:aspartyl protease family protein [Mucilaginibacter sp.]MDB4921245.1 Aspartyl protease [Mucilaginibacter sp.]